MSRIAVLILLCGLVATPAVVAQDQDHAAVGVYADHFRLSQTDTSFAGVGGRLGLGLGHHLMLEGEMSYDFNQVFTETFERGGSITVNRSNFRLAARTVWTKVQNLRDKNVMGAFYPGGGLEGHIGPIGLRLDVGDEIYFNGGTHNNCVARALLAKFRRQGFLFSPSC